MTGEGRYQAMIDAAARGMCNADEQRHMRLERRNGTPCRLHENAARHAVEAVLAMTDDASGQTP